MTKKPLAITSIVGLFIVLILVVGCGGGDDNGEITHDVIDNGTAQIAEPEEQEMEQAVAELRDQLEEDCDCNVGELEAYDTDGDGTDDKWTTSFGRIEIEEGLYEQQDMTFEMMGSELHGTITIGFENKSDQDYIRYEYIMEIPKSFAESIDDIEFSDPSFEIIDSDPSVKYLVDVVKGFGRTLVVDAAIKSFEDDPWGTIELAVKKVQGDYVKIRCKKLPTGFDRANCVILLAELSGKPELCDQIGSWTGLPEAKIEGTRLKCKSIVNLNLLATSTPITPPETPVELDMHIPAGPHKTGDDIAFKVTTTKGVLPENPYYEWDFGDGSGIGTPFSNEATHFYSGVGDYMVKVVLYEKEGGKSLATTTAKVTIEGDQGMSMIQAFQATQNIEFKLYGCYTSHYEEKPEGLEDKFPDVFQGDEGINAHAKGDEITWNGSTFEIEKGDLDASIGYFTCTGTIAEDGSMILELNASLRDTTGNARSCTIKNVPLTDSWGITVTPEGVELERGSIGFEFEVEGSEVQSYVEIQSFRSVLDAFGDKGKLVGVSASPGCPDLPGWENGQKDHLLIQIHGTNY